MPETESRGTSVTHGGVLLGAAVLASVRSGLELATAKRGQAFENGERCSATCFGLLHGRNVLLDAGPPAAIGDGEIRAALECAAGGIACGHDRLVETVDEITDASLMGLIDALLRATSLRAELQVFARRSRQTCVAVLNGLWAAFPNDVSVVFVALTVSDAVRRRCDVWTFICTLTKRFARAGLCIGCGVPVLGTAGTKGADAEYGNQEGGARRIHADSWSETLRSWPQGQWLARHGPSDPQTPSVTLHVLAVASFFV